MKHKLAIAVITAMTALAGPALAEGWVTPENGRASSYIIGSNDVIMLKVSMPPAEFQMMEKMMKMGDKTCTMMEIYPGASDTVIIKCGS